MPYNSHINLTFRATQAGQTCENEIDYSAELAVSGSYASDVCTFVRDAWWAAMRPLLSTDYRLLSIEAQTIDTFPGGGISETFILDVDQTGLDASDTLPPNVTLRIVKVVDNGTIEPPTASNFRNGFVGFSGIPEGANDNGLVPLAVRN
ncbi:MAG TPA: hypothetical protein VFM05_02880, partial [Candidatus Saccharimonadales bacterium]|nr:hypothetical protein [Candidatus Saccharimonadales bacterium]